MFSGARSPYAVTRLFQLRSPFRVHPSPSWTATILGFVSSPLLRPFFIFVPGCFSFHISLVSSPRFLHFQCEQGVVYVFVTKWYLMEANSAKDPMTKTHFCLVHPVFPKLSTQGGYDADPLKIASVELDPKFT